MQVGEGYSVVTFCHFIISADEVTKRTLDLSLNRECSPFSFFVGKYHQHVLLVFFLSGVVLLHF
jgi:hypothetical protein